VVGDLALVSWQDTFQCYDTDFGLLMGPLAELRVDNGNLDTKSKQPLVIDRLPPYGSNDLRIEACNRIERAVCGALASPSG
jgi:hypothetical protein